MPCRFRRWRGPSPACGESRTRHIPAQAERCTPAQATTIGSPAMPPLTSQIYSSTPTTRSTPSPPRSSHHPLGARTPTALVLDLLLPHSVLQKIANRSGQDCGKNSTKTIDGGRFHTQVPSAPPPRYCCIHPRHFIATLTTFLENLSPAVVMDKCACTVEARKTDH